LLLFFLPLLFLLLLFLFFLDGADDVFVGGAGGNEWTI